MGVNPATFSSAGQSSQHYIPGAYSRRNFVSNEGGGVSSGNVCILGYADLGEPQTLQVFSNANDARAALLSGEGLEGVIKAFAPGNDLVPQEIGFMRVNPGTQSSRVLQLSAVDVFTVKSYSYGVPMNQLKLKFSAGTTPGTYKIETEYKGTTEEQDDIENPQFSIQYVGAGSAATLSIDETTLTTVVTGGPGGEDLSITLSEFSTVDELVSFIDSNSVYDCTILAGNVLDDPTEIDYRSAVDILTSAHEVKADYHAVLDALNSSSYLDGNAVEEGVIRTVPDVDTDFVYLSGATTGSYTTSDFTDALAQLELEDVQIIATPATDAAVHLLIRNHCIDMNSVEGRKERQFYVGGALGETVDDVVTRAKTLNSSFGSLCSPGYYGFDDDGDEVLYSPGFYACLQAGQVAALALNTPTTHKTPNILKWEKDYTRTELNTLIKGGVLAGGKDTDSQFITVRSITTYQSALLQKNEASIMRESLYQSADLRNRMEKALVGTPNLGNTQLAVVDSIFERAIRDWSGLGIIVANDGELYSGYTRRIVGDQIVIEYNTWNTAPTNFVFITHNISLLVQE